LLIYLRLRGNLIPQRAPFLFELKRSLDYDTQIKLLD